MRATCVGVAFTRREEELCVFWEAVDGPGGGNCDDGEHRVGIVVGGRGVGVGGGERERERGREMDRPTDRRKAKAAAAAATTTAAGSR